MKNDQEKINGLLVKLDALVKKQDDFTREINDLKQEISKIQGVESRSKSSSEAARKVSLDLKEREEVVADYDYHYQEPVSAPIKKPVKKKSKSDFEKFIGENLINKIGIIITIIGVAIGTKYAIDHQLASPLTRIISGYMLGAALLGFALKLRKKYENYSAVLLSGSMAILYFVTFSAYNFYDLIPQIPAFILMVLFTAFTVFASLNYNRRVIAIIGLVGAYAVPFLLSDGSGQVVVLFSYVAIINTGILIIAFKKYWYQLFYSSFILTWLIFGSWYVFKDQPSDQTIVAMIFALIYFLLFYLTFLAYKVAHKEVLRFQDIILPITNSFIYYGIGYSLLNDIEGGRQLLGLFTVGNALIHFVFSLFIYKRKLADRNVFYLISGLVLIFITIAIPVQLDGNWVTLLWAMESALLFWIARSKKVAIYEKLAWPLMMLALLSQVQEWATYYHFQNTEELTPLFNVYFLSSLLFIGAFGFINYINRKKGFESTFQPKTELANLISFMVPSIFLIAVFATFRIEIDNYWHLLYEHSAIEVREGSGDYPIEYKDYDLKLFGSFWMICYGLFFASALSLINTLKIRETKLAAAGLGLIGLTTFIYLTDGLLVLSDLRSNYLDNSFPSYFESGKENLFIRYISYAFMALALLASQKQVRQVSNKINLNIAYDIYLFITLVWIASSELIHWMDLGESNQSYKLGLSILWGISSLLIIALGIWKKKRHLRIGAIVLFAGTLIKLFLYDISHLNTLSKTIVFVSLGILLLIISFLYNKFKHLISDDQDS